MAFICQETNKKNRFFEISLNKKILFCVYSRGLCKRVVDFFVRIKLCCRSLLEVEVGSNVMLYR